VCTKNDGGSWHSQPGTPRRGRFSETGRDMEFQLLGPLEARQDGRPVDLGDRQQRYVLAALLLEANKPVSMDRLIEIVWGPAGHGSATKLINGYISRLRRIFREARADELQLDKDRDHTRTLRLNLNHIDYFRFAELRNEARLAQHSGDPERALVLLREATELWHGEFLEDLDNDTLRRPYRRQLERIKLETLHDRALLDLDYGNYGSVQDQLYPVVAAHRDNERLAILLVRAMLEVGDRSSALDMATRTVMVLREKGMEISLELKKLQVRALRGESGPLPARLPRDLTTFTGREAEQELLLAAGRIAEENSAPLPVMTISGMPGVGKTALAIHAAHQLASNFPDGQLFVDLCGFVPNLTPVAAQDALGRLLNMLGVPGARLLQF
jgi:DNA-binding SARP family transcriptional activator